MKTQAVYCNTQLAAWIKRRSSKYFPSNPDRLGSCLSGDFCAPCFIAAVRNIYSCEVIKAVDVHLCHVAYQPTPRHSQKSLWVNWSEIENRKYVLSFSGVIQGPLCISPTFPAGVQSRLEPVHSARLRGTYTRWLLTSGKALAADLRSYPMPSFDQSHSDHHIFESLGAIKP